MYIKTSKDLSARYYLKKKRRLVLGGLVLGIKVFLKKRDTKSENMDGCNMKIFEDIKNKSYLSLEKNIIKQGKIKPLD